MPLPSFWSDQFGMRIQSFGAVGMGVESHILEGDDPHGDCVVGYLRDGVLMGIAMIGHADRAQHYRNTVSRTNAGVAEPEPAILTMRPEGSP
ncbi:oxidoreductase C-terminal domain-containing protein [Nonomuraea sp. NPDC026600]|uniref:oxidoreductase C-terminal domain-containing protein n=1 Tax=Nonomuraea sp. NPDC026600 TaxID=3155363 RepID=UPI0033D2CC64